MGVFYLFIAGSLWQKTARGSNTLKLSTNESGEDWLMIILISTLSLLCYDNNLPDTLSIVVKDQLTSMKKGGFSV